MCKSNERQSLDWILPPLGMVLIGVLVIAANTPHDTKNNPMNYGRSLGQAVAITTSVDAAAAACLTSTGGGSTCALFSFGSINVVKPSAQGTCCWSQRRTGITVGAQGAETEARLSFDLNGDADTADSGETIDCAGHTFAANEIRDMIAIRDDLLMAGPTTYLGRYCKKQLAGKGGELVSVPCSADAECNTMTGDASSGACQAKTAEANIKMEENGAAYLHCRPAADATLFRETTER